NLLPVLGQDLVAGPAEPGAMLLQAREHDRIASVHVGAAEARHVTRAGIVALLRRSGWQSESLRRGKPQQDKQSSRHRSRPSSLKYPACKVRPGSDVNALDQCVHCCTGCGRTYFSATVCDFRAAKSRSITARQPGLRSARCLTMQAVIFGILGMSAEQRRKASLVHICCASSV